MSEVKTTGPPDGVSIAYELVYCETDREYNDLIARFKAQWPTAKFEDGSDMIHEHRFSVTVDGVDQEDLYRFMLRNKCALQGLCFNLAMYKHPEQIKPLVDEWKEQNKS